MQFYFDFNTNRLKVKEISDKATVDKDRKEYSKYVASAMKEGPEVKKEVTKKRVYENGKLIGYLNTGVIIHEKGKFDGIETEMSREENQDNSNIGSERSLDDIETKQHTSLLQKKSTADYLPSNSFSPAVSIRAKRFRCTIPGCESTFTRDSEMVRHRKEKHGETLYCPYCNYPGTKRPGRLYKHMQKHITEKVLKSH